MISCDTVKTMLSDYLDLAVNPELRQQIDRHLQQCPECQKVYTDVQVITQRLRSSEVVQVSPDFNQKLRSRIMQSDMRGERTFTVRNLSFGVSGAAVVAALSFFVMSELSTPSSNVGSPVVHQVQPAMQIQASNSTVQKIGEQGAVLANRDVQKDSLKKTPETVDKNQIKLVDQGR